MYIRESFVRVVNRGYRSVEVQVDAIDDQGMSYGPATLMIGANEVRHFNSEDLEMGNAMKGLSGGMGMGMGNWQVVFTSTLPLDTLAYVRIEGTDDTGAAPGSAVELSVAPGAAKMVSAQHLERGGDGLMGALGDGEGKWRLQITSEQYIEVSLLESPAGHMTNVSAVRGY